MIGKKSTKKVPGIPALVRRAMKSAVCFIIEACGSKGGQSYNTLNIDDAANLSGKEDIELCAMDITIDGEYMPFHSVIPGLWFYDYTRECQCNGLALYTLVFLDGFWAKTFVSCTA